MSFLIKFCCKPLSFWQRLWYIDLSLLSHAIADWSDMYIDLS